MRFSSVCWICANTRSKWRPSADRDELSITSMPWDEARLAAREDDDPAAATACWPCRSISISSSVRPSDVSGTAFVYPWDDVDDMVGEARRYAER